MHETIHRYLKKKNEKGNEEREREETSMKKFKKLLVGLLAGAMMLGSMSATAFAADASAKMPTIDTTDTTGKPKKGSLTIHKYEYNGTDTANKGTGSETDTANKGTGSETDTANKGTGSETDTANKGTGSETDTVPEGAKPLAGAGFTLYKVADVKDLTKYYSKNPTDLPSVDSYFSNGEIDSSKVKATVSEVITNAEGIAEFTDLQLGFYVVIETTTPDKVTTPANPFLVSIPMTTVDGDNWLYDVHVYPKNKTTYGSVTLEKKGNNTTALSGVTFVLQKQNGTGWTNVTKNEKKNSDLLLVTNPEGKINVDGLSQGTYRFIETDRGNNDGYIMDGATTYEFTVTPEGKITYNGKTDNNITIIVTNEKPDMTKQVKDRTAETETWGQDADYNVGDMVPYKITVDVPSNITKLKEFTLTDTPKNLDDKINDKLNPMKVACANADVKTEAYSVAKDGEHGFKITFIPAKMDDYAGKQLVITYKAELLSTAVTTTVGNTNSAKLEYSNKILPGQDDPDKDYIENTTTVYTFGLQVVKKAEKADGAPLEGVKFDLYKYAGTESNPTEAELKTNGTPIAENLTTGKDGTITQKGLANGTYYLVETKTNKGYNLLKAPVKVELNIEYTTTKSVTDENGVKHEVTETEFKENNNSSNGTHTETIINKKGFTLPTTGGMGTIAITALGVALAFAGVLIIGASRKKTVK